MLRSAGHAVQELESGGAVLAHLREARPDVLVADVAMPGMNGVELASEVRRAWPACRSCS